jgi:hypothetical protein
MIDATSSLYSGRHASAEGPASLRLPNQRVLSNSLRTLTLNDSIKAWSIDSRAAMSRAQACSGMPIDLMDSDRRGRDWSAKQLHNA